jgi:predicted nucleotidyltransferase
MTSLVLQDRRLPSGRVPRAAIRRYVHKIVAKFHPQKVILFGSHAYGKPTEDSDVDLLVVMNTKDELEKAAEISAEIETPLDMDVIVRSPANLRKRVALNDWFMREIVEQGVVLYDAANKSVGEKGRGRLPQRTTRGVRSAVPSRHGLLPLSTNNRKVLESVTQ